jgi:hypothetical protein
MSEEHLVRWVPLRIGVREVSTSAGVQPHLHRHSHNFACFTVEFLGFVISALPDFSTPLGAFLFYYSFYMHWVLWLHYSLLFCLFPLRHTVRQKANTNIKNQGSRAQHFPSNLYSYPYHNHQQQPKPTHVHPQRSLSLASARSASWIAYSLHLRSLTPIWTL